MDIYAMISGYAGNGHGEEAATFFVDTVRSGVQPDDITFGAVLHACSSLAVLGHGKMVHGCILHYGFHAYVFIGNGLVNMYAKCGDLQGSVRAFSDIFKKDLVSWNAMLFAFGLHGHNGLIEESRVVFETMGSVYGISPEMDHAACMVDMLGRGGYLAEAKELIDKYSGVGSAQMSSCEALFGACFAQGDNGVGRNLGESLKILEPHKETSYVLLSNLYCASGQWKEAEMVRKMMVDQGVKKMPGCSWDRSEKQGNSFCSWEAF